MRLSIKEKAGIVDSLAVFEGIHIKRSFLEEFVHNKIHMHPVYREEIEKHLLSVCDGKCQKVIDGIVLNDEREDYKLSQIPESDR